MPLVAFRHDDKGGRVGVDKDAVELGGAGAEAALHIRGNLVGGGKGQFAVDDAVEADQRRPAHVRQAQVMHIGHLVRILSLVYQQH